MILKALFIHLALAITALISGCANPRSIGNSLPPMPEAVTSFGAVTHRGEIYVFGGHKGERHDYSIEMVSGAFHRLNLVDGRRWETLQSSDPGQGLALIAHRHSLYRMGGMAARNHADEHESLSHQRLYSVALFQRFDLHRKQWKNLVPLPCPRSSHDAVVVDNKIYVAGGWELNGTVRKPVWHTNALVFDLDQPQTGWGKIPQPFQRRGLALAALKGKVFCIGGMDSDNDTSRRVDIYNTVTGDWSRGPDLPKGKYNGFSCSAIAQNGHIYVSCFQGDLLQLSNDEQTWEKVGRLEKPRLAHRLVTAGATKILALGGEDREENKVPELQLLTPTPSPYNEKVAVARTAH
ncbi:MAG TPA: kelch repeat-containing protein [Verrucomicrobiae bacterium]|nr:kelch repeat-containing protein [Verrucomicrobiae bacterium]